MITPMELLYAKKFSKDVDKIQNEPRARNGLLKVIEKIKLAGTLSEIKGVRKIEGYQEYYRIRIGEYRLGMKITENTAELIRFLHRKDIYRRFP